MKFIREWGLFIVISLLFILTRVFIWAPVDVKGHSMDPNLADGQRLIMINSKNLNYSDIVVANETEDGENKKIIKRVIGLPGDSVEFNNDTLTINGKTHEEPYLDEYKKEFKKDRLKETYSYDQFFQEKAAEVPAFTVDSNDSPTFKIVVPENQYLLLGDNRVISKDSREVGTFEKEDIMGKAVFRIWPFKNIGTLK
ncbi:signal peptidase I [Floricoccus tropicus]|uniref:Signal peptidase I n=1 Tax=Floricoccus tropicus TaxID=1859473 RepID=A0A1E8GM15_9LACT|nr:signal peptidase I [Floricoccus tropicus]OFI49217.1 signal peptidase I [Floricoccus tropicus]